MIFEKCGKCEHWMKKADCPREAKGIKPSCADWGCSNFKKEKWATELEEKQNAE